ncbi:MAG: formate-dependent phosphoribosylglycinamide formyltransferase, partial [Paludibacteraceae bacterium]|nr:formate-dependent phosphoribosylglycinamide formyltransferase [Paludibacteraceae bacterium]
MKKIMLLGSGELGKEFVIACKRKGQYVIACDKYPGAPAMQVADEFETFSMLDGEALMAAVEKHKPDIIVPEIEAIRTEKLYECEKMGIKVVPSARAVNYTMNRKAIRELAHTELGLKTAEYRYATTLDEMRAATEVVGFPCIVKPLMSSSGHGQSKLDSPADIEKAWKCACEGARGDLMEVIVEQFIPFDYEITLLTVTQQNGKTLFCPPIGHVQKGGDYRESFQPRKMNPEHLKTAQEMADKVTAALTGAGIWGVEFFISEKEGVYFSELSPRPHDTGMVTLAGTQNLSEFELHCRAVLGLPIPEIVQERQGVSAVILSETETDKPCYEGMEEVCAATKTYLRIFGKPEAHVGRRMGVVV